MMHTSSPSEKTRLTSLRTWMAVSRLSAAMNSPALKRVIEGPVHFKSGASNASSLSNRRWLTASKYSSASAFGCWRKSLGLVRGELGMDSRRPPAPALELPEREAVQDEGIGHRKRRDQHER